MHTSTDEFYMQRCLELARNGLGNVAPNPMVGCVIVCDGKIIGEGYHQVYGEAHAEVNAIKSVKDEDLLRRSTLYVNLEPCAHYGKTPPCSRLIIEKNIPEIVIGSVDTFSEVSGKGIEMLRNAGRTVRTGVLEKESRELNRRFFTFHEKKRPYIIFKWAETRDGFVDVLREEGAPKQPTWITNELSRTIVHKWRAEEMAILVGTHTAEIDNPSLTVREWNGKNPLRLVIDKDFKLDAKLSLLDDSCPTKIFVDHSKAVEASSKMKEFKNTECVELDFRQNILIDLLAYLHKQNVQSLIVEGGSLLLESFVQANLWDEALIFKGNKWFKEGVKAPHFPFDPSKVESLWDSELLYYRNEYTE